MRYSMILVSIDWPKAKDDERPTFDLKDLRFYRSHRPLSATLEIVIT